MGRGLERVSNADKALLMHADLDTGWKDRPPWHATVTDSGVILYPPALSCVSKSPYKLPFIPFLEFPQLKLWTDHKLIMLFATNMQNRIQPYPYIFLVLQEFFAYAYITPWFLIFIIIIAVFNVFPCFDFSVTGCGQPPTILNARRSGNNFALNAVITYTCDPCYQGGGTIRCQPNGQWTRQLFCTCEWNPRILPV